MARQDRTAELETALANVRRALLDGNWSLALGHVELALGQHRKAAHYLGDEPLHATRAA